MYRINEILETIERFPKLRSVIIPVDNFTIDTPIKTPINTSIETPIKHPLFSILTPHTRAKKEIEIQLHKKFIESLNSSKFEPIEHLEDILKQSINRSKDPEQKAEELKQIINYFSVQSEQIIDKFLEESKEYPDELETDHLEKYNDWYSTKEIISCLKMSLSKPEAEKSIRHLKNIRNNSKNNRIRTEPILNEDSEKSRFNLMNLKDLLRFCASHDIYKWSLYQPIIEKFKV